MIGEHSGLLTGNSSQSKHKKYLVVSVILSLLLISSLYQNFTLRKRTIGSPEFFDGKKKNVIFFVSDGMGPASLSMTRSYQQFTRGLSYNHMLNLDAFFIGSSRTRSSNSLVTDSAAGATAFSCGLKTYNGAIGMDPEGNPCGTVLESAKLNGYLTGLVVTTRVTDATPASFSAHADMRNMEQLIAQQQMGEYELGRMVDLIIGGGRTNFYPRGSESSPFGVSGSRTDDRDSVSYTHLL